MTDAVHALPSPLDAGPTSTSASVHAGCLVGIESCPVQVEARLGKGLPAFEIVGLPERGVRESRVRVQSALASQGLPLPRGCYVLNLAPGDLRKSGAGFDLAIAIALHAATGGLDASALEGVLLVGELALDGSLRSVRGVLAHLRSAADRGMRQAIVPRSNEREAALLEGSELDVRVAGDLRAVVDHLEGNEALPKPRSARGALPPSCPDLAEVKGQPSVRRALEIAAAGRHHLLMLGPPGAGKTMLARRLPGILPPPDRREALAIATLASVAGGAPPADLDHARRPFRAPHHTASAAAMIGGGEPPRPGEVTLAHRGVLFLDELPEFRRDVIETLRTTMELGEVRIARARYRLRFPADALIVAAMNPCPCGYAGDRERLCSCTPDRVDRYRQRISGPLVDRFDLHVAVPRMLARDLRDARPGEPSAPVAERVVGAHRFRAARMPLGSSELDGLLALTDEDALDFLDRAVDALGLSARGFVKALRVARTIADLEASDRVRGPHVAEAVQYRLLDRRPRR